MKHGQPLRAPHGILISCSPSDHCSLPLTPLSSHKVPQPLSDHVLHGPEVFSLPQAMPSVATKIIHSSSFHSTEERCSRIVRSQRGCPKLPGGPSTFLLCAPWHVAPPVAKWPRCWRELRHQIHVAEGNSEEGEGEAKASSGTLSNDICADPTLRAGKLEAWFSSVVTWWLAAGHPHSLGTSLLQLGVCGPTSLIVLPNTASSTLVPSSLLFRGPPRAMARNLGPLASVYL